MKGVYFLTVLLAAFLAFAALPETALAQEKGKIGEFEEEVEEDDGKKDRRSSRRSHRHHDHCGCNDDAFWAEVAFHLFFDIPDRYSWDNLTFNAYPYANQERGWMNQHGEAARKMIGMNFTLNNFRNGDDLNGMGFRGRVMLTPYASVSGQYTKLTERLPGEDDYVELYNAFINFNRFRTDAFNFWWGAGVKGIRGSIDHTGPAFNMGADLFLKIPVSIHGSYNVGELNDRAVQESLIRLNYHLDRTIFYVGYQDFRVGDAALNGWIYGIGIYL